MKRTSKKYRIKLNESLKQQLLLWSSRYDDVVWLDSNNYEQIHSSIQAILATDALTSIKTDHYGAFDGLHEFQSVTRDWLFGYLSYDLKNDVEDLRSENHDMLDFPELYFFQPKRILIFTNDEVELRYMNMVADEIDSDWKEILAMNLETHRTTSENVIKIRLRTSKDGYFDKVGTMLRHIERGDIYEANFCQEFYAEDAVIHPERTFQHLNDISRPPFAAFFKSQHLYALSASPNAIFEKTIPR